VAVEGALVLGAAAIHVHGLAEEDVGAVALGFLERPVVEDGGVEVGVAGGVAAAALVGLADAARAVDEDLVEPRAGRLVLGFVAEVPLAEDAGGVAGVLRTWGRVVASRARRSRSRMVWVTPLA
jgi:hypothetical protein